MGQCWAPWLGLPEGQLPPHFSMALVIVWISYLFPLVNFKKTIIQRVLSLEPSELSHFSNISQYIIKYFNLIKRNFEQRKKKQIKRLYIILWWNGTTHPIHHGKPVSYVLKNVFHCTNILKRCFTLHLLTGKHLYVCVNTLTLFPNVEVGG